MKKLIALFMVIIFSLSIVACSKAEETTEPTMTVEEAVEHLLDGNDLSAVEFLLNTKDDYKKLTGEDLRISLGFEWIEKKRIYKNSEDGLSSFSTYTGNILLKRDGTGETLSPGNEPISWLVDGDYLYFKTILNGDEFVPVTTDESKYQFEVREIFHDDNNLNTVYACYSTQSGTYQTIFLLVHPQGKFA